jgi:hypothetical protein
LLATSLLISRRARRYRKERQLFSSTFHLFTNTVFLSSIWEVHLRDVGVLYDLKESKRARKKDKGKTKVSVTFGDIDLNFARKSTK